MGEPAEKVSFLSAEANEEPNYRPEATSYKGGAEKKPQASEEIMIEEISIDGMCGVY